MPIEIVVPRLGWSMEEGVFGEWRKNNSEPVAVGDILFVLEGEKAAQEIESFDAGLLHIPDDAPKPGDPVVVGQLLGFLLAEGEEPPTSARTEPASPVTRPAPTQTEPTAIAPVRSQKRATPRARRKAQQLGIDWVTLTGSGRGGRVRERDVLAGGSTGSKIRQATARRLTQSARQTVPVTLTTKANAEPLARLRRAWTDETTPGITDVVVWCVGAILPSCPELNAHSREAHVAFATDTERGLLAPVVMNVEALSLAEVAERSASLVEKAHGGTLTQADLQGATFTVSNLGMFGIDFFTPVIDLGQSAILGVGRILDEPVVIDEEIRPGKTLALSLTFDHRAIDGAPAARWLARLGERLESL